MSENNENKKPTNRFDYVKFDETHAELSEAFKEGYSAMAENIESIKGLPKEAQRARALCLTKLEESFMWFGKMVRDSQVAMNGSSEHLPERNDS